MTQRLNPTEARPAELRLKIPSADLRALHSYAQRVGRPTSELVRAWVLAALRAATTTTTTTETP